MSVLTTVSSDASRNVFSTVPDRDVYLLFIYDVLISVLMLFLFLCILFKHIGEY